MARLIVPQRANYSELPIDPILPMTCVIESSYIINGHGEYSIRITRILSEASWIITKRFREFVDLNNTLKEYGFNFELPKKKLLGNTNRLFMAQRQAELQVYLNTIVQYIELCNSLTVHRFLDPASHTTNYPESALQHVSMFVRSMNNLYQIIEPLHEFGWRYNKCYFIGTKTGYSKDERYLLVWSHYGLDRTLGEKEITSCLKLLKSISHPFIAPIDEVYANESGTLTIYRYHNRGSLKDYLHRTKPIAGSYWKRYGPNSSSRRCDLNQIKMLGRQILEALYFLYENNLLYGHLHSGNVFFDFEQTQSIKLFDITNSITGVSSKYRYYLSNFKHIHTLKQCDIYAFGRLLYELSTGEECPFGVCAEFPYLIPNPVQEILSKILVPSAHLPTIEQLLNEPFFQTTFSTGLERFQLKLNTKAKEAFEQIHRITQERLAIDQIKIKSAQHQLKISSYLMSDEEKLRRRRERKAKALEKQFENSMSSTDTSKNPQYSIHVDPLQSSTPRTSLSPSLSIDLPIITNPTQCPRTTTPVSTVTDDQSDLLSSITDFNPLKLKKTITNDRSAPIVK